MVDLALIQAIIGFVPKRKSHAMRAIPKLKNDIPAIRVWV
jgi:hypothetical protein